MEPRAVQRITAALVLLAFLAWTWAHLARERPPRDRPTVGQLLGAAAALSPVTRLAWQRLAPVRGWLATHAPRGLADAGLSIGLGIVLSAAWIGAALLEDVYSNEAAYDAPFTEIVTGLRHPWAIRVAEWISEASSPGATALVGMGVVAASIRLRRRVEAVGMFAATAGAGLWTTLGKILLARERPGGDAIYSPIGDAFPSGHVSGTAAVYVFLAWLLTRHGPPGERAVASACALAAIGAVAACRLYLAVHWLSDVVAGAALGIGWSIACILWTRHVTR